MRITRRGLWSQLLQFAEQVLPGSVVIEMMYRLAPVNALSLTEALQESFATGVEDGRFVVSVLLANLAAIEFVCARA